MKLIDQSPFKYFHGFLKWWYPAYTAKFSIYCNTWKCGRLHRNSAPLKPFSYCHFNCVPSLQDQFSTLPLFPQFVLLGGCVEWRPCRGVLFLQSDCHLVEVTGKSRYCKWWADSEISTIPISMVFCGGRGWLQPVERFDNASSGL